MNKKQILKFTLLLIVISCGIITFFLKINKKSTDEICQEKANLFVENQEYFEKLIGYVEKLDYSSIIGASPSESEITIDGLQFYLYEMEEKYELSILSKLSQLTQKVMDKDGEAAIMEIIGKSQELSIYYDKQNRDIVDVLIQINDPELENVSVNLIWHNIGFAENIKTNWVIRLDDNWHMEMMGRCAED